jgi:hypothetical protein
MSSTDRVSQLSNSLNNSPKVAQDALHCLRRNIASSLGMTLKEPAHATCKAREIIVMVKWFVKGLQICLREGFTQFLRCANAIWELAQQGSAIHPSEDFI